MAPPIEGPVEKRMKHVKNIIIVLAGKGGVGKSSISTQLALSLHSLSPTASSSFCGPDGKPRVGILDIDLTGPSVPRMLGLDGRAVHQSTEGWVPVYADGAEQRLACMSVGFLLKKRGDSVVWRGPKKNAMIRQFLTDVRWGDLDYLVIDTPPGTSDEHLSLLEHLAPLHSRLSSVIVTTPQAVALVDSLKCLSFTRNTNLPVLGLIENMSGYVCPCCGEVSNVFSTGGGEAMASKEGLTFLGALPIDTQLVELLDGEAIAEKENDAKALSEPASNGSTDASVDSEKERHTFALLERYQGTPTYALFSDMSTKILSRLQEVSVSISAP
ncbi:P-loop containing nucleoside triphosphate hydrolase protein [Clavulina sp. PMI_390]|nr:P-loop containing nucleoside triphosphate hydrolase protein [Clavulina sp. PMI_390]